MSWEAVAWANRQRLRLPQEQLVLLVLANCADADGCAFARWRGRDHWWNYIQERTRLSRASIFRHLKTIETLGLALRVEIELADGGRRPIVHLDLEKFIDVKAAEEEEKAASDQSHGETETECNQSHGETAPEAPASLTVRPDQSHGETAHIIESKRDSNTPQPPKGGGQAADEDLERDVAEARRLYPDPITDLPRFRAVMAALTPDVRQRVLTAIRGYAAFIADCARRGKARGVKDAHRWVASGMWEGYLTSGETAEAVAQVQRIQADSPTGRAWILLHRIAGIGEPAPLAGEFVLPSEMQPNAKAFADPPDEADWVFVAEASRNQVGAWRSFLGDALGKPLGVLIRERSWRKLHPHEAEAAGRSTEIIAERGFLAPWAWPPRKDGTISQGMEAA